jgi:hypothetical protein
MAYDDHHVQQIVRDLEPPSFTAPPRHEQSLGLEAGAPELVLKAISDLRKDPGWNAWRQLGDLVEEMRTLVAEAREMRSGGEARLRRAPGRGEAGGLRDRFRALAEAIGDPAAMVAEFADASAARDRLWEASEEAEEDFQDAVSLIHDCMLSVQANLDELSPEQARALAGAAERLTRPQPFTRQDYEEMEDAIVEAGLDTLPPFRYDEKLLEALREFFAEPTAD